MYDITLFNGITETLRTKGKRIVQANCVTQFFPKDGAFMQTLPISNSLSVGAILEPDKDEPFRNVWLLIPVTSVDGNSAKPADFNIIKQYLEEFIVCSKSCFLAYKNTNSKAAFYNCASKDTWVANNFYQVYISLEKEWDVHCKAIDSNPNNCVVELHELVPVKPSLNKTPVENKKQANNSNFRSVWDYDLEKLFPG